jgi:predicted AAA+ superfamily ATPase
MIPRLLGSYLHRDAGYYPVLTLTGPRQSGKTTLARASFPEHAYVSLEDRDVRALAIDDPREFLARHRGPTIIDEAQRAPDLLAYLQRAIDEDPTPGRIVLTGSQNLLLMEKISQTLAGRCAVLHLLPFSGAELARADQMAPDGPQTLFANREPRGDCWEVVRTGFYPPIHDRGIPPEVWLADYLATYVERDVRSLVNIGDLATFERFLKLCAGRVGQLLSYSGLASDCGVSVDTARRWLSVLITSFLVFTLEPHHRNFSKRVIKSPKLFFYDVGLACHLLGIRATSQLEAHPLRGALFENLVVAEVAKAFLNHRMSPPISFWRDQTGHEVDLLVEDATRLYPVEIRSGLTVVPETLETLKWWTRLAGTSAGPGTLVYGGSEAYTQEGFAIRPWFAV